MPMQMVKEKIHTRWSPRNHAHFVRLGYPPRPRWASIEVWSTDLPSGSTVRVRAVCTECAHESQPTVDTLTRHSGCKRCTARRSMHVRTDQYVSAQVAARNYVVGDIGVLTGKDGTKFLVDAENFGVVSGLLWHRDAHGYAATRYGGKQIKLHRMLTTYEVVDHINRDRKDNRRSNLREGVGFINAMNRPAERIVTALRCRGVTLRAGARPYCARVSVGSGRRIYLGRFNSETEAAKACHRAAIEYGVEEFYPDPDIG